VTLGVVDVTVEQVEQSHKFVAASGHSDTDTSPARNACLVVEKETVAPPRTPSETVRGLRRQLDQTLNTTNISDSTVDHWQSVADGHGRTYRTSSPVAFLLDIAEDIAEVRSLTDQRLPTAQQRGICNATGRMAGLLATTLVNLGEHREARAWFHTAQRAADESEDPALRAWVLVRHAVSALYWNDAQGSLELATQATLITRHIPCVASAWAPAVQARALARLRRTEATRLALGRAADAFTSLAAQPQEQHAYGYTAAQLHFYRSNALTEIGDTDTSYQAQEAALAHYGPGAFLDPSLVRIDRALCLINDGEVDEAVRFAARALITLPHEHRSPIILERARGLTLAIPAGRRTLPAVREFHEVLAALQAHDGK
jgi:tetratricopeptide (TPR) repeat protein